MVFYEKYAISHVNFSTGWITIDVAYDEYSSGEDDCMSGLLRGFSKIIGGEIESLGMMQYRISKSPYDFIFQWDLERGIVIVVEDMRKITEIFRYIKTSLDDINMNLLYEQTTV